MNKHATIIGITKPIISTLSGYLSDKEVTPEQFVIWCARVSNPSNQHSHETAPKLMKYLIANNHWSPFEMASIVMEINTTRDISRQILRHRSFSFQEFSQRYANAETMGYEMRETRIRHPTNRQASLQSNDQDFNLKWELRQKRVLEEARDAYLWAVDNGVAKEQARAVLPEGLVKTRLYMSGTLRSWIHYCKVRIDNGTQKEHSEIAKECWSEICSFFPSIKDAVSEENE